MIDGGTLAPRERRPWVVLIMDLDPDVLFTLRTLLETHGYVVVSASTPTEARALYSKLVDVAVVDIGPGSEGLSELMEILKAEHVPTLGITASEIQSDLAPVPNVVAMKPSISGALTVFFDLVEQASAEETVH